MKHLIAVTAAYMTIAGAVFASPISDTYTSFYVFGDSLSDDGNGLAPASSPYFGTRFTNGETWAEDIENLFTGKDTEIYARGGATATGADSGSTDPARQGNLAGQIGAFQDELTSGDAMPGDNPLISIWMGANDLFGLAGTPLSAPISDDPVVLGQFAAGVAGQVALTIQQLALDPMQSFDDFLVFNLPKLNLTPLYTLAAPQYAANAALVTEKYNEALGANLSALELTLGINIMTLDIDSIFEDIASPANPLGFLNVTSPCVFEALNFNCAPTDPAFASAFLFQDLVHPTRPAHAYVAQQAIAVIENDLAAVPLPASAPLLLAGFGLLGWYGRRRQAA